MEAKTSVFYALCLVPHLSEQYRGTHTCTHIYYVLRSRAPSVPKQLGTKCTNTKALQLVAYETWQTPGEGASRVTLTRSAPQEMHSHRTLLSYSLVKLPVQHEYFLSPPISPASSLMDPRSSLTPPREPWGMNHFSLSTLYFPVLKRVPILLILRRRGKRCLFWGA